MIDTHPAGLPDSGRGNPRTKNYRTGGGNPGHPPNREARVGGVQHGRRHGPRVLGQGVVGTNNDRQPQSGLFIGC